MKANWIFAVSGALKNRQEAARAKKKPKIVRPQFKPEKEFVPEPPDCGRPGLQHGRTWGNMRWYAVMTKARKEQLANWHLKRQGYQTFFPHYKQWTTPKKTKPRELIKPYLTRYLFVGMGTGANQSIYTINNTIGVSTVVYCGYSALSIPASIIEELKSRADSDGEIPVAGKKKPEFAGKIGDRIRFKPDSPSAGLIWEIKGVDNTGNLVVELENQLGSGYRITSDPSKVGEILTGDHTSRPFEPIDGEEAISP